MTESKFNTIPSRLDRPSDQETRKNNHLIYAISVLGLSGALTFNAFPEVAAANTGVIILPSANADKPTKQHIQSDSCAKDVAYLRTQQNFYNADSTCYDAGNGKFNLDVIPKTGTTPTDTNNNINANTNNIPINNHNKVDTNTNINNQPVTNVQPKITNNNNEHLSNEQQQKLQAEQQLTNQNKIQVNPVTNSTATNSNQFNPNLNIDNSNRSRTFVEQQSPLSALGGNQSVNFTNFQNQGGQIPFCSPNETGTVTYNRNVNGSSGGNRGYVEAQVSGNKYYENEVAFVVSAGLTFGGGNGVTIKENISKQVNCAPIPTPPPYVINNYTEQQREEKERVIIQKEECDCETKEDKPLKSKLESLKIKSLNGSDANQFTSFLPSDNILNEEERVAFNEPEKVEILN